MMLMAGMKDNELSTAAPIGGMAAVMIYQPSDLYGRSRSNPVALRGIAIDKLRERILGLDLRAGPAIARGAAGHAGRCPWRPGEREALRYLPAKLGRQPGRGLRRSRQQTAAKHP